MASLKLVKKNLLVFSLLCVVIAQIYGTRIGVDEEPDAVDDARIVYDQRQSGKYNIHVVIKDVAIIEMDQNEIADQNYGDEEYYYDEGDLTIKPLILKPTTPTNRPSNLTTKSSYSTKITTFTPQTISPVTEVTVLNNQEETTFSSSILWSTLMSTTTETSNKQSNTVVLNAETPIKPPAIDVKPRSKIEPIYAIEEPVLHPKHHLLEYNYGMPPQAESRDDLLSIEGKTKIPTNSKIYKVKVHRSHQPHHFTAMRTQSRRCRSNQYRDSSGNCRGKRSSSGSIL